MMDKLLENNTILKILSVIVAIFIWFQAHGGVSPINRPVGPVAVGYYSLSSHLTVMSITPSVVTVEINGPPGTVDSSTTTSEVSASINLGNITKPGTYVRKVAGSVPAGTGVVSVTPARVVISMAKMGQVKVPLNIHIAGQPASGDILSGYKADRKNVTISGPTSALSQVRSVVGTLSVQDRSGTFHASVVLHPVDREGNTVPKVEVNPPTARVTATIQPKPPEKVLPVVGKIKGKPASGFHIAQITVYPSTVMVSGTKSVLSKLTHVYAATINVSGATKTIVKKVPVILPTGTSAVSSGQVTVTVTIIGAG